MPHVNAKKARKMLSQACKRYIGHNEAQLNTLDSRGHGIRGDYSNLAGGLNTWLYHVYKNAQHYVFWLEKKRGMQSEEEDGLAVEHNYFEDFKFGQMRLGTYDAPLSNPCVILHNLTALNRLFHHIMTKRNEVPKFGYKICLKSKDTILEKKTIYLEMYNESTVQYTFIALDGQIKTDRIYGHLIDKKLPDLFTRILKITSEAGDTLTFDMELKRYRQEHHRVYPGAEDTPLGWYQLKENGNELIGKDSQKSAVYQNKVIIPEKLPNSEPRQKVGFYGSSATCDVPINLLLPYMESRINEPSPLSIEIYNVLENIKSLFDFVNTLPDERIHDHCDGLGLYLNNASVALESYLKGLVAKELKATLDDSSLSDEDALKAVETQLKNPTTAAILTKNRQSQSEYYLKMLSVVSILIGVGIFTTLGLVFKRLYDSGGSSINFFKPLSKNLVEDVESISAQIEPAGLKI